jgi:hypothetical protein
VVKKAENKQKELSSILSTKDSSSINEAVKSLREEEPFEGAIGLLVSFYDGNEKREMNKIIEEFFNDIKDLSVRPEIIAEIRKRWKPSTISMLVASCWQSGLDYSDYLTDIVRTFLKADYPTAIECMTVIEQSSHNLSRNGKDELISMLMESPQAFLNEKKLLVHELLSILRR